MKKLMTVAGKHNFKLTLAKVVPAAVVALMCTAMFTASADSADLNQVTEPVIGLIKQILNVLIPVVGAAGALFCVGLGVKFARAEEPQEREKAKQHLKNAIIGFVLIFVLIVALRIATPILTDWMNKNSSSSSKVVSSIASTTAK